MAENKLARRVVIYNGAIYIARRGSVRHYAATPARLARMAVARKNNALRPVYDPFYRFPVAWVKPEYNVLVNQLEGVSRE